MTPLGEPAAEAVVLAGGAGTRLRDALPGTPKVLAPILGRPFLHHLFDHLTEQDITSVTLATGHAATQVERVASEYAGPLELRFSREEQPLGTGGAIARAFERVRGERAWVFNGDSFCGASLRDVEAVTVESPGDAWLVAVPVGDASRFGTLVLDGTRIVSYLEKSGRHERGWINAGIYLLPRGLAAAGGASLPCSIERDLFPGWATAGILRAAAVETPFIDIGTPESLAAAESFFRRHVRPSRPFVFLDRDGTIIVQKQYLSDPKEVELIDGAAAALKQLRAAGFGLAVVTNQSGIGRGLFDQARLDAIHDRMRALLAREGAAVDAIYACPHAPEQACACRKPAAGMIEQAAREHAVDLSRSWMVGDKDADVDLARTAGLQSILVRTGYGRELETSLTGRADLVTDDLREAAERIIAVTGVDHR